MRIVVTNIVYIIIFFSVLKIARRIQAAKEAPSAQMFSQVDQVFRKRKDEGCLSPTPGTPQARPPYYTYGSKQDQSLPWVEKRRDKDIPIGSDSPSGKQPNLAQQIPFQSTTWRSSPICLGGFDKENVSGQEIHRHRKRRPKGAEGTPLFI